MKRKWLGLALAAAMACAGAATQSTADVLAEDSAANYTPETFVSGANEGTGFGAWEFWNAAPTLADSAAGLCGDINSENGVSFRFARDGDDEHYGYCNGYRGFTALNPGDVLTFRFTCAYCAGNRGLDLFANGGHDDNIDKIANVINLSGADEYSVNGVVIASNFAPHAVSEVTVTQLSDGIEIAIKRTSTEEGVEDLEYSTKVETDKKLTGIGLYAGGWEWKDGEDVENYAFYVNDLKIEGEPPVPPADTLSLSAPEDAWKVLSATEELEFTVSRTGTEGALEVALSSSSSEFASVPESVTIADGETSATFTVQVALSGFGNEATVSVSAPDVAGAEYTLRGPKYRMSAQDDGKVDAETESNFWVNWENNGVRDDSKLTLDVEPEGALTVTSPSEWTWNDEDGGAYVASTFTAHESGKMILKFDGVELWSLPITVPEAGATLSGPTSIRVGVETTYTLDVTLPSGMTDSVGLVATGTARVEIDPATAQDLDASTSLDFTVTALEAGAFTLKLSDSEGITCNELEVTASEAPDYSDFIAYDDASFYGEGFDYAATGVGIDKFQSWVEVFNNNDPDQGYYAGAIVVDKAPDEAVLTEGKAFALYSNGGDGGAEIRIRRPFVNSLSAGQEFSVLISPNYRDGAKGIVLQGEWEGNWYDRVEFYCSGDVYAYKINGGEPVILDWAYGTKLIDMSLTYQADGSSYTLAFSRDGDEDVVVEGLTFEGTVDGALFYSWNGGQGDENNFVFNSLAIEQVEEPVVVRTIGIIGTWNMDATGDYEFMVGPAVEGPAIGEVALTVSPDDGRIVIDPTTVEVPGDGVATFTVTVTSLPEEGEEATRYTITATPADTAIPPATFDVTPSRPYLYLSSEKWKYTTDDGTIWICLHASPSFYDTYAITSSDDKVLSIPEESASRKVDEGQPEDWFSVTIVDQGEAKITASAGENSCNYGFTITPGTGPGPEPVGAIRITNISISKAEGKMTLTLDRDGTGATVWSATAVNDDKGWAWTALDLAVEGTTVDVPMDGAKQTIKVE